MKWFYKLAIMVHQRCHNGGIKRAKLANERLFNSSLRVLQRFQGEPQRYMNGASKMFMGVAMDHQWYCYGSLQVLQCEIDLKVSYNGSIMGLQWF